MNYTYEYKVISERDARLSGRFDLETLEATLNDESAQGWRLVEGLVASSVWKSGRRRSC